MDVTKELDAVRTEVSGCDLVAFADLSSGMVLCTSADQRPAQEDLEALCDAATASLDGELAGGASAMVEADGDINIAMTFHPGAAHVFLRSQSERNEALCCVCAANVDIAKIVDCGRSALNRIVAQE